MVYINIHNTKWCTIKIFKLRQRIKKMNIERVACTAGEISIEHVTIFLSKYISKGAIDMKFSPDVDNNPRYPYIQRNQNK